MSVTGVTFLKFPHLAALEADKPVEYPSPIHGRIENGEVPSWLRGSFYRNGPGMIHFNEQSVTHWFDGMALPRRFEIKDEGVFYQSRFVRSQSYQKNMEAGRIVVPEFGTHVQNKQQASFLTRAASRISLPEFTDNCLVNFLRVGEHLFGISETNLIRQIDPITLETMERVDLSKYLPVNMMSSTPLTDSDGTVFNFTTSLFSMGRTKYNLVAIPKPNKGMSASETFKNSKCIHSIDSAWRLSPSYHHSFSMTDRYAIFIEQPFKLSIPKIAMAHWSNMSYSDCLEFHPELKTNFHVIDKETGARLSTSYISDPFIVYQNINAFEREGHLIVDLCCFDAPVFFQKCLMENLKLSPEEYVKKFDTDENRVRAKRFVLLLDTPKKSPEDENLVKLSHTTCKAFRMKDNIFLHGEVIYEGTDYPAINPQYLGKPYKYYYSSGGEILPPGEKIMKVDIEKKEVLHSWQEKGCWASRPEFVPRPNATEEDDGVLLSPIWRDDGEPFLLILDAKTFHETRIAFDANIPPDLHGLFVYSK